MARKTAAKKRKHPAEERVVMVPDSIEVARVRITDAGRRALAEMR
jgi:hypothetical protein